MVSLLHQETKEGAADVAIVIGTYGDLAIWGPMGERAMASVRRQTTPPRFLFRTHAASLAEARNEGALRSPARWQIFLDGDDELGESYVEEMVSATGDVRIPDVECFRHNVSQGAPFTIPRKEIRLENPTVVGAMHERERFLMAGGFEEHPVYEDWALWVRMHYLFGAKFANVPRAVYKVHLREGSRNVATSLHSRNLFHEAILRRYSLPCG